MVRNKDTKEYSSLSLLPPIQRNVQSASTRNSAVMGRWRQIHQNHDLLGGLAWHNRRLEYEENPG